MFVAWWVRQVVFHYKSMASWAAASRLFPVLLTDAVSKNKAFVPEKFHNYANHVLIQKF